MSYSRVGIVGLGYVGLSLVKSLCAKGIQVIGLDIDKTRVLDLQNSISPNESISNEELQRYISSGTLRVTTDPKSLKETSAVIIAVPTPLDDRNQPDYRPLQKACEIIATSLKDDVLLINESTSHPGTLRDFIAPLISQLREDSAKSIKFACSPERVNPGDPTFDHSNTPRVVSGLDEEAKRGVKDFYAEFAEEVFLASTPEVAEMSKLLENSFRLINISFINEISDYCLNRGIPIREVIAAASTKPFGFMAFYPGPGIGGHCIPVDPAYLLKDALSHGSRLPILQTSLDRNTSRHELLIEYLERELGGLSGKKILLEGVTYKPNVTDTRETPSKSLFDGLLSAGAKIAWHDPLVSNWNNSKPSKVSSEFWDATLLLVKHNETAVSELLENSKVVYDFTGQLPSSGGRVRPI